jgi:acetylornithine deacetylase/succinyl-diaminopimelate desuccinylase-like protein
MRRLAPLLLLSLCCALPLRAAPIDPADPEQAVLLLQEYLRIDTTNPPGHELATAQWVAQKLEAEGIAARIDTFEPGRANLLAVLKGSGARRPVVLASHMDVVPADPTRWSVPPFSGTRQNGFL